MTLAEVRDTHGDHKQDPQHHNDFWGGVAAEAWSLTTGTAHMAMGAARVTEHVAVGFGKEVVQHPGRALAEVAGAAVVGAVAVEAGVGLVGAAAIAAVPLAAYGVYKGVQIATHEGIGAIPKHLEHAVQNAGHVIADTGRAIGTVYHGGDEHDSKFRQAEDRVEDVGRAGVPIVAGLAGGEVGAAYGPALLRGGSGVLRDAFAPLALEPAYAYPIPRGEIPNGTPSPTTLPTTSAMAVTAEATALGGRQPDGTREPTYDSQQLFIEGKLAVLPKGVLEQSGILTKVQTAFKNAEQLVRTNGGRVGNMQVTIDNGTTHIEFVDGPLKGAEAMRLPGEDKFAFFSNPHDPADTGAIYSLDH
jgi:hypothetical protein